ncbi:MAG: hypothetical protein ACOCW4_03395 [bacterium]
MNYIRLARSCPNYIGCGMLHYFFLPMVLSTALRPVAVGFGLEQNNSIFLLIFIIAILFISLLSWLGMRRAPVKRSISIS